MKGFNLSDKLSTAYYRNKPAIFVIAGMAGTAVATFFAWKAGRNIDAVMEEIKQDVEEVHVQRPKDGAGMTDYRKKLASVYIKSAFKVGKVVAPAVLTEATALASIGYGFGVLNERHLSVVAFANAQSRMVAQLRQGIAERYGEEAEKELYYGYSEKEVETPEVDEEGKPVLNKKGEPKVVRSKKEVLDEALKQHSMYAKIYDEHNSREYEVDPITGEGNDEYNEMYVKNQCKYLNMVIYQQKYHMHTLNAVYDLYGLPQEDFGQSCGWHSRKDPLTGQITIDKCPSNKIEVMLFPVWYNDDVSGKLKKCYIIDFNVPGGILNYYDEENKVNYENKD